MPTPRTNYGTRRPSVLSKKITILGTFTKTVITSFKIISQGSVRAHSKDYELYYPFLEKTGGLGAFWSIFGPVSRSILEKHKKSKKRTIIFLGTISERAITSFKIISQGSVRAHLKDYELYYLFPFACGNRIFPGARYGS